MSGAQQVGGSVDRIRLVSLLGEGRSGRVFVGVDEVLRRQVVVKRITAASFDDADQRKRLIDEARILSTLEHPNVVRIHDYAEQDGEDLFTLEYAVGKALPELLAEGLDFAEKVRVATAVGSVLAAAHRSGVVHGALSPQSIVIADNGDIKVVDFRSTSTYVDGPRADERWLSTEQLLGDEPTPAADMYSFGLLLREMFGDKDRDVRALIASLVQEAPTDRATAAVALERLGKLGQRRARRIRTGVIAFAALFFLVGGAKYTVDLRRGRAEAVEARKDAEYRRAQANELVTLMIDDLHPKLENVGRLDVMDAANAQARSYFASIREDEISPREVASNAKAVSQLGLAQVRRGDFANGLRTLEHAVTLAETTVRRDPKDDELKFIAGTAHADLAVGLERAGMYDQALAQSRLYGQAIGDLARRHPKDRRYLKEQAYVASHLGTFLDRREESAEALPQLELALSIKQRVLAFEQKDEAAHDVAVSANKVGLALLKVGRLEDARFRLEEGRAKLESLIARNPSHKRMRMVQALYYNNLALTAQALGDIEGARRHAAAQRAIASQLTAFEPEYVEWAALLASALCFDGIAARMGGDAAGAVRLHRQAIEVLQNAFDKSDKTKLLSREIAVVRTELAYSLLAAGRSKEALEMADLAIQVLEPIRREIIGQRALANALLAQGVARAARGDAAGADAAWQDALRVIGPIDAISMDPRIADTHARILVRLGRAEQARPLIENLVALGYRNPEFKALPGTGQLQFHELTVGRRQK